MQFPDNLTLEAALKDSSRVVSGKLEFDWMRDGTYSGHDYCDLSDLLVSIDDDRQTKGDLPDSVNTLEGFSSAELTIILGGSRRTGELLAHKLFSPFLSGSPLAGTKIRGVPIRYSDVVTSSIGEETVRVFTGWLRTYEILRERGEVRLVCSDITDFEGGEVTLPRWARYSSENRLDAAGFRPISATWAVEETLRQGGRPTGPLAHPDVAAYWTCNGSFLPSVGSLYVSNQVSEVWEQHSVQFDTFPAFAEGKYGLAPTKNANTTFGTSWQASADINKRNCCLATAAKDVVVPANGSGQNPVTIGFSAWIYSDGTGTGFESTSQPYSRIAIALDDAITYHYWSSGIVNGTMVVFNGDARPGAAKNAGQYRADQSAWVDFFKDGTFRAMVHCGDVSTGPLWRWQRTTSLSIGWHYVDVRLNFQSSSISITARVDDAVVTMTTISNPAQGYAYSQPVSPHISNAVWLRADLPIQHAQIYAKSTSAMPAYSATQGVAPTREGKPLAVVHGGTLHELLWMPEVYKANPWKTLQQIASGGFDVVHTDEYGTIHYVPHYIMRTYQIEDLPDAVYVTDDRLMDTVLTPTEDQYRNVISIAHRDCRLKIDYVWTQPNVEDFWDYAGSVTTDTFPLENSISVYFTPDNTRLDVHPPSSTAPAALTGPPDFGSGWGSIDRRIKYNYSAAVYMGNLTVDAVNNTYGSIMWGTQDQRYLLYQRFVGNPLPGGEAGVVFSWSGGESPSSQAGGRMYDEVKTIRTEFTDSAEVALYGRRVLKIEDNDWIQGSATASAVANNLLADTVELAPIIKDIELPMDPRRQLRDIMVLQSTDGISDELFVQVIGIKRRRSLKDNKDTLTLRVIYEPNEALWSTAGVGWDEGTWAP